MLPPKLGKETQANAYDRGLVFSIPTPHILAMWRARRGSIKSFCTASMKGPRYYSR